MLLTGYVTIKGVLLLLLLSSCSVFEDRTGCPCQLHVRFTRSLSVASDGDGATLTLLLAAGSWQEFRNFSLPPAEDLVEMMVPKKREMSLLAAVCPGSPGGLSVSGFEIPSGADCPPGLLLGAVTVDTDREQAFCELPLHKSVCRLILRQKGEDPFPFGLRLLGGVSGFLPSGALREGAFSYVLPPFDGEGVTSAGIPRQPKDGGSLHLEILFSDEILRSFALGEILVRGGYDWTAPDLRDVEMELDYARTRLTLRIEAWSESVILEKVL